jgi:hypothetical protein
MINKIKVVPLMFASLATQKMCNARNSMRLAQAAALQVAHSFNEKFQRLSSNHFACTIGYHVTDRDSMQCAFEL